MSSNQLEFLEHRFVLAAVLNGDVLEITGTDNPETISVDLVGDQIIVSIDAVQTPFDADDVASIDIDALGGADTINVNVDRPTTILGGSGDDTVNGSDGGEDSVVGQLGADTFNGRGGDDIFVWNPGDGSDVMNGDDGFDTLLFFGSGADENFDASAVGDRLRFFRNVGNIVIDAGTTEGLELQALGGNDNIVINDLSGTPVTHIEIDAGSGNDTFVGSSLPETFLGGEGNDMVQFGNGDFYDMGDGTDSVQFIVPVGSKNVHVSSKFQHGHTELFIHGGGPAQSAVFDNGEVVNVVPNGTGKLKIHKKATDVWDVLTPP